MDENLILPDPRPSRADALRNRELLLSTARRLFAEQGVQAVTMSAIVEAAGVGKGTLYRHFSDKSELCHALIDQQMFDLQERTLSYLRKPGAPFDKLLWFLRAAVNFVQDNNDLLCEASNHAAVSMLQHPAHLWWRQTILGLLQQSQIEGDLEYRADLLYVMLDVQTIRFQTMSLGYDFPRIIDGLHEITRCLTKP